MPLSPIQQPQPEQKHGLLGKIAGIAGKVLGGGIGFLAGGPVGAVVGSGIGGTVGDVGGALANLSGGGGQASPVNLIQSAVKHDPALQIGVLREGQRALKELPIPLPEHEAAHNSLEGAINEIRKRNQLGGI